MEKLLALMLATVVSWIGWWVGAPFGTMTALLVSIVGGALGLYAGRRLTSYYLG